MGLQDNRILSPFLAMWVLFLSPLVWGGPSFFFCVLVFFLQSPAANTVCTNWRSENKQKKKTKPQQQQQQQQQKVKKLRQPNSSEVHCYLLAGNRPAPKAKCAGIVGPLAHFIPGDTHMERYTARSTALQHTMRR